MPTTCATCRAEIGDAAACPHCGTVVLSPQSQGGQSQAGQPQAGPTRARHPLDDEDLDVTAHLAHGDHGAVEGAALPTYGPHPSPEDDDSGAPGIPAWVAWTLVALALVLTAVIGVWLLFSSGNGT